MLSSRLYSILSFPLKIDKYIRSNCSSYDENQQLFIYHRERQLVVRIFFFLMVFYSILKLIMTIKLRQEGEFNKYHLSLAFLFAMLLVFIVYGLPAWFSHDGTRIVNGAFTFFRYLHKVYMPGFRCNASRMNKIIDALFVAFMLSLLLLNILVWLICICFPRGPLSFGPLIPARYYYLPIRIADVILHCCGSTIVICNLTIWGSCILMYLVYFTIFFTTELRLGRKSYRTQDSLRTASNIRIVYRSFQLLHQNAMCFLGVFLLICNATFMLCSIYVNFVLIRYWDELNFTTLAAMLMGNVMAMGFWSVVLELGRMFFARGTLVLVSWRGDKWGRSTLDRKLMRKFVKSCKPIVLSFGKQFVVGRVSILIYFRGIVRGTMRALLTT